MQNLKIAVVGVGLGGRIHTERLIACRNVDLAFVAPDSLDNKIFAKKLEFPIYHSLDNCIDIYKPDGVIIASPNNVHAEQAILCIQHKIPILLEKPITGNLEEGSSLCRLIKETGARVLIGHHRAHNPLIATATREISDGRLGDLVTVTGSAQFIKPTHYFEDGPWRKILGGGPILINMIHEVDILRRLVGEITHVHAISSNKVRGFQVEDTVVMSFVFENGALGSFVLSDTAASARSWEQTSQENPGYPVTKHEDCYLVSGTKGSLSIPTLRLRHFADGVDPSWWTPFKEEVLDWEKGDPIMLQLLHFFDVLKGNTKPLVTAEDGFKNLLIIDAIQRSAASKEIIEIDNSPLMPN